MPPQLDKSQYLRTYGFHTDPFTPLQEELVYRIRANTRYAVEENQRVQLFVELCRTAAPAPRAYELMGELMYQSHYAYTECGLGAKATDFLVGLCRRAGLQSGIYGAKITGGGAGGTVAILASNDAKASVDKIFDEYAAAGFGEPFLFEGSSAGADSYGVLVISKA